MNNETSADRRYGSGNPFPYEVSMTPPIATRMFKSLVKEWVLTLDVNDDSFYSPAMRAARKWCSDNGCVPCHTSPGRLVFKNETDALLYYVAHKA